jgi:predicted transcriptional regulator
MPKQGYSSITLSSKLVRRARKLLDSPPGDRYHSLTELASEALEEKLEALMGAQIVSTRTPSREEANRMIVAYLKENPGAHYPSDIAYTLGLDLEMVFEVTESLLQEHMVETRSTQQEIKAH